MYAFYVFVYTRAQFIKYVREKKRRRKKRIGRENLFTYKICLQRAVYLNPNAYGIFELIELLERKEINLPKSF